MRWAIRPRALLAVLSTTLAMLAAEAVLAASEIRSVRLWRAPDNTRLVFDLSGPVQHSVFTLSAPERIVIDVDGAQLKTRLEQLATAKTPISSLRVAERAPGKLRIVLDMTAAVTPKSFSLAPNQQYGHRLVVDLFDQDEAAPQASTPPQPAASPASSPVSAAPARPLPDKPLVTAPPVASLPPKTSVAEPSPPARLPPVPSGKRDIVIAIDAGHGGEDPGALGPRGLREKDVVLAISRELQRQINSERGFRAELVRSGDYFIPLRKRTEIARKKGADLFVSIHADAAPRAAAFGASVFALSDGGATSETARWLADKENRSDLVGGVGSVSLDDKDRMLAGVLLDLSMTATLSSSLDVGHKVLSNMGRIAPLHKRRVEQAGFMVLKSPDIPSILVETGFISNPGESQKLSTKSHQQALAHSIHSGIRQFFHENPPPGSYIAWLRDQGKIKIGRREHVVAPGESLALIAQRYQVGLPALRSANRLGNDSLKAGQLLIIPAQALAVQP
ncbi:N-acetylmuramoyl-L-alanine amidase [Geopseudomonas sagittaria]|uniref:N-acetylmuramoyl-L-alanine amidase AmiC n=1 Tax=Geopseudomonas sagittaria TaxID=1135990 RepID=A0A1I5P847_9GAMM|nr:N-acetylmuramoyl-L-alanine amidase [Pseudomonas sagittaria]MCM2330031.1 N-acetylmuramoyl-L-alanine amidase [Pseudomonas sagittaria]SFP30274.1 N-acetylmuramoyl-L-alanine amidase [Pseudomonas sagittaria]